MDVAQAGKTYSFDGGKVLNCSNKAKVYTCPTLQLPEWDDKMIIGDGYTVDVNADVGFGWNHGLRMSGTARLTSTGSINLTGLAPGSLVVNGGSIEAGGTFSVAGPTPFKADVTAGTLSLGTGTEIQITGKMVSRGAVSIASYTTIVGPVSGTSIMTNSPFKITGEVKASDTLLIASSGVIDGPVSGTTSITINSPATLSSTVTSQGPVQIGSHANIGGAVKGTVITADSPVTLKGDITATSRFTLGSGSTVSGNIVAPEVELYASQSNITGNITASKLLTMGDSVKVKGTVDTGTLTMYASNAIIEGIAKVNFATLYWNGRVTQPIVCKAGTRPGYCDCVDNQSGNPVNTANGPRCESAKPVTGTFSHFLIEHDGKDAATCSTKNVTVSACANDDCSQKLATPTKVIMQPGGATVNFTGSATAQVSSAIKGKNALSLTLDGAATSFKCRNTTNNAASCDVTFTGDVGFKVSVPNHRAGNWVNAELQALRSDGTVCKPAFANVIKPVQYSCSLTEPTTGTLPVKLSRTQETNPANPVDLTCAANKLVVWDTTFDGEAKAPLRLTYTDAGKVTLNAKTDEISGADTFVAAPDHFDIVTPSPLRAGLDFDVNLTARNASGATTPNFNKAGYTTTANATRTTVSMPCTTLKGVLASVTTEFSEGKATVAANYSEAGSINLRAELQDFLGTELDTVSTTGKNEPTPCTTSTVGPFVPMYFQVELNDTARIVQQDGKDLTFYYSREPIPLKITAMNAKGQPTTRYPTADVSAHVFKLSAAGTDADVGVLAGALAPTDFLNGVATPRATFQFAKPLTAPTPIRVRVENDNAAGTLAPGYRITSANKPAGVALEAEQAKPEIRSGRLRIANIFGYRGASLKLPVRAEYWTDKSWALNERDSFSKIPAAAMAQTPSAHAVAGGASVLPKQQVFADLSMQKGEAVLPVQSDTSGWIDIAFNLRAGTGTGQDQSCLKSHPQTSFANLPWLQSLSGCTDPSGRATFGIFAPESRRIIHMREVFN